MKCVTPLVWFSSDRSNVYRENFFKGAGEVVDVRFSVNEEGRFKGFGHVEFATAEAAKKVNIRFWLFAFGDNEAILVLHCC